MRVRMTRNRGNEMSESKRYNRRFHGAKAYSEFMRVALTVGISNDEFMKAVTELCDMSKNKAPVEEDSSKVKPTRIELLEL